MEHQLVNYLPDKSRQILEYSSVSEKLRLLDIITFFLIHLSEGTVQYS
jgi:hypothetical protein